MPRTRRLLAALVLLAVSCGADPSTGPAPAGNPQPADEAPADEAPADDLPGLVVLTTVDPIADLARHVLGERGEVTALVGEGDAHTFEPAPSDAILMGRADLFLTNGLGLNEAAVRLAEANLRAGAPIVTLADLALADEEVVRGDTPHTHGGDTHTHDADADPDAANPHVWMDVAHAIAYVRHIADALTALDPAGEEAYRANAARYTTALEELDAAIMAATATIPEGNRVLVSYHDSWAYYAPRYGLEHIEAVQPSDHSEPSAAEVRAIIDEINTHRVPVVFGASEFPSDVLRTIAAETGATYIGDLSDDEFPGGPGDPEHSYIGLMLANARAITEGLGGDASPLDAIDPAPGHQR